MTAGEIFVKTRLYLRDMGKTIFSDYEIYQGINDALRLFAEESARAYDSEGLFRTSATLALIDGSVAIPPDFIKLIRAFNANGEELLHIFEGTPGEKEFAINKVNLTSGTPTVKLNYYCYPNTVSAAADTIYLPESMLMAVAKIAAYCVAGSEQAAIETSRYFNGARVETAQPQNGGNK